MNHPDWYPEWRHEAVHQLQDKVADLRASFRLDAWPRFHYDLDAGLLTFSENGVVKVVAEIQIAGTTSLAGGDWLWAWANSHWPAERVVDAELARAFGEEHGICELSHESVRDENLNALGWELTAVTARLVDALGAYRPPDEDGGLYLLYKSMSWVG